MAKAFNLHEYAPGYFQIEETDNYGGKVLHGDFAASELPMLTAMLNGFPPAERQELGRLSPEDRAERRKRLAEAFATLWEHRDEIAGIIGTIIKAIPK